MPKPHQATARQDLWEFVLLYYSSADGAPTSSNAQLCSSLISEHFGLDELNFFRTLIVNTFCLFIIFSSLNTKWVEVIKKKVCIFEQCKTKWSMPTKICFTGIFGFLFRVSRIYSLCPDYIAMRLSDGSIIFIFEPVRISVYMKTCQN